MNWKLVKTLAGLLDRALTPEGIEVEYVAAHFERALRAAYRRGVRAVNEEENQLLMTDDDGVTAGVAAMMEES